MCPYDSVLWNTEKEILEFEKKYFQRLIYGYLFSFMKLCNIDNNNLNLNNAYLITKYWHQNVKQL